MGINPNGWKRDVYSTHYPSEFEVLWVEDPKSHAGVQAAYELNQAMAEAAKAGEVVNG